MHIPRTELIRNLNDKGLVQMGSNGHWQPTREGRVYLAEIDLLGRLAKDDRIRRAKEGNRGS